MKKGSFFYRFSKRILGVLFVLYYNPKFEGKENIPAEGPILIAGNHVHLYDQCLTILSTKRGINYMAKKEYFEGKFAWFFKLAGCISVNRNGKDEEAKNIALGILRDGGAIGIFPEGTRNRTEDLLLPFKFGCVSMAKKTDAYIVPFGISGEYKFRSKTLKVRFGKPFKVGDMDLEKANEKLFNEVKRLVLGD